MVDDHSLQQQIERAVNGPEWTEPGVERPWERDDILDFVEKLDSERAFGDRELTNWATAANNGKWIQEEVHSAIEWVNLYHTGFLKIAHVHARIVRERELLHRARYLSHEHPRVAKELGYEGVHECIDAYNRDIFGWKESKQELAFAVLERGEWIEWAEHVR